MKKHSVIPILIFIVASVILIYGLKGATFFWVDEFSTAHQANMLRQFGLNVFSNHSIYFETNKFLTTFLVALSFNLFGQSVIAAKIPFVIIGSFLPVLIFYFLKRFVNLATAITSAVLINFSYFLITWSIQAREYTLLLFIIVGSMYEYFLILQKKERNPSLIILIALTILLGLLTHPFYYIFLVCVLIHFVMNELPVLNTYLKKSIILIIPFILALLFIIKMGIHNNFWYYHEFLWGEYSLVTYLGLLGLIVGLLTKRSIFSLIIIYCLAHFIFIDNVLSAYTSRYTLPVFLFLLIGVGYLFSYISSQLLFKKRYGNYLTYIVPIVLAFSIIGNGHKFVRKPIHFYSVDHDFRDIALIDYNQVYNIVKTKGKLDEHKTAMIDTWPDRLNWYMGMNYPAQYVFRWGKFEGRTNGLPRETGYIVDKNKNKIIPTRRDTILITELSDLKRAMKKYPKGFIFIDDSSLPHDVIEYVEKNFKKELYLDHYQLDDNPYSIWPATLYSWGIE